MRTPVVRAWFACLFIALAGACHSGLAAATPQRVVSLGGSVTEIVYALKQGHTLIGSDLSSVYPEQALQLPRVGYYRSLPLEGLVSLRPDLILASEQAGPPDVLARVQQLGISVESVRDNGSLDGLYARIRAIAVALGVAEQGTELAKQVQANIDAALADAKRTLPAGNPVSAVMVLKRTSQMMGAGANTTAGNLLRLAGLHNPLSAQPGYKPLSAEAVASMQPELIITTTSSIEAVGGKEAFLNTPGINLTPAAKRGQLLVIDDMLILGLGPRTAQSIDALTKARNQAAVARTQ